MNVSGHETFQSDKLCEQLKMNKFDNSLKYSMTINLYNFDCHGRVKTKGKLPLKNIKLIIHKEADTILPKCSHRFKMQEAVNITVM